MTPSETMSFIYSFNQYVLEHILGTRDMVIGGGETLLSLYFSEETRKNETYILLQSDKY